MMAVHEPPSKTVEWYTPPWIFDALGMDFDLDPASPLAGPVPWVPARNHYTAADDGLAQPWEGTVWLNPPYGPQLKEWCKRMAEHGAGVLHVYARTDTTWFQDWVFGKAQVVCFIRGRVKSYNAQMVISGTPGAGHILAGYGSASAAAVLRCGLGATVVL